MGSFLARMNLTAHSASGPMRALAWHMPIQPSAWPTRDLAIQQPIQSANNKNWLNQAAHSAHMPNGSSTRLWAPKWPNLPPNGLQITKISPIELPAPKLILNGLEQTVFVENI